MANQNRAPASLSTFNREYARTVIAVTEAYKNIGERQFKEYRKIKSEDRAEFCKWSEKWLNEFKKFEDEQLVKFCVRSTEYANKVATNNNAQSPADAATSKESINGEEVDSQQFLQQPKTQVQANENAPPRQTRAPEEDEGERLTCAPPLNLFAEAPKLCTTVSTEPNTSKELDRQPPSLQDALADCPLIVMLSDDDASGSATERPPIMSPTDQSNVKNESNVGASQAPPIQPITCSVTVSNLPKIPFKRRRCSEDTKQDNQKNSEEMKKAKARERMRRLRRERKQGEYTAAAIPTPVPGTWCMKCKNERYVRGVWLNCFKCHGCWASPNCSGSTTYVCELCL